VAACLGDLTASWKRIVQVRRLAILLLAGCLTGCGSYAMLDPETTASLNSPAASSDKSDSAALSSLFARATRDKPDDKQNGAAAGSAVANPADKPVVVADAGDTVFPSAPSAGAADKLTEPRGRAYLFRGVAGLIYSRGMDKLADRIKSIGITSSVDTYLVWRGIADEAIRDYRRDPEPITLIGHSMGGDSALAFAERLNSENIPVSLLVTYDPSRIADDVPPNVERYINIYQSSNFMGGGNVVQGSRFHGHYASYNLKDHGEIIHINIEKTDHIQEQLVAKVAQLAATPANGQGDTVPIRLQVPADAAIDLWDSGLPVRAHAGDTLKTLAATYRVPLWSLTQINSLAETAVLNEGQRVVVPRYLTPMAPPATTVSSYAPER